MEESGYAKDPLLYIHQPERKLPKAQMQSDYYSINEQSNLSTKTEPTVPAEPVRRIKRNYFFESEQVDDDYTENDADLDIKGKVQYFVNRHSDIVQIRCEVLTQNNESYKGVIYNYKDDTVFMRSGRRNREISFNEISDIKILGF